MLCQRKPLGINEAKILPILAEITVAIPDLGQGRKQ